MNCYYFTDYIQIHTIQFYEELICMDGAYQDPVAGKLRFTYFEAEFQYFYDLLSKHECFESEAAMEAMARMLSEKSTDTVTDLGEGFIQLHDMVFRLTEMVEDTPSTSKHVGFFIEDAFLSENGSLSFQNHLYPPDFSRNDRKRRVELLRTYKIMSGYLVALALRYEYYNCQLQAGAAEEKAASLACLEDEVVWAAARAASHYIALDPTISVVHINNENQDGQGV